MQPTIGVGVFAFNKEGQFVVGERKGSHGAGTLALPGGHLEWGETFETCAAREVKEETGLIMRDVRFLTAIDDIDMKEGKHFVVIVMGGLVDQEPKKAYGTGEVWRMGMDNVGEHSEPRHATVCADQEIAITETVIPSSTVFR